MYVDEVKNRNGVTTTLVRESYREDGQVKKRTVANISHLPAFIRESIRQQLKGQTYVSVSDAFSVLESKQHGHVEAVMTAMKRLKVAQLIDRKPSRERDLVLGMIAARIIDPGSKLATTQSWKSTSLPRTLGLEDATEDHLYHAMDWLLEQQPAIEKRLAKRHLEPCGLVLYDLTSSYVEGTKCPLASRGYSRDGKPKKLQVNYGILTDEEGRPVAVNVYEGRTTDPTTVQDQLKKLKEDFDIDTVVFVGDRGMLAQTVIDKLIEEETVEWITALKSGGLRKLHTEGSLQMGLFDKTNIFEFTSEHFPGERLVACRNEELGTHRARKRLEMLNATIDELAKVQSMVQRGKLKGKGKIGVRAGRVINKFKMAKHFALEIRDGHFSYHIKQDSVSAEAALDGIYVIRTSVAEESIPRDDVVRHYKRLTRVERTFRSMKMSGLQVRPIYHRTEPRVRAHIFLCMLAQYVQWHMRHAWRSLLFAEEVDTLDQRHPVNPSKPSEQVKAKKASKQTADGLPVHSFRTLLRHLSGIVKNTCKVENGGCFEATTIPDPLQERALRLLQAL